ncbi:MAG: SpoIIE family protein phosphatase [Tissierellia bacterium]|jgi:sigma-B regulation protein RsbU (phosphoserine phosphatase)|nr:SpoIIE family protein phosphatase [Tissierellia bacterium]
MLKEKGFKNYHFEILDNVADLIRIKDLEDNIIYTNNDILDSVPIKKNILNEKESKSYKMQIDSIDGIIQSEERIMGVDYSIKSSPIFNNEGKVIASVEVFRDVTRERELEKALMESTQEIEQDLVFAKLIQRRILPSKGSYGNLHIDFRYEPSKHLSGDIFDIFDIDEDNIGIYIVDVSGHGVAASMLTVFIRQIMYSVSYMSKSPSEIFKKLQKKYAELDLAPDRYFTMFFGIYNKNTREFKYANAGHNSIPFLFNKDSITMLVNYGLPILGFDTNNVYKDKSVTLVSGDSILMYTDGLIEAKNEHGEEFGEDRVKHAILETKGNLLEEIEEKHSNFIDLEQQDDIAMLLMKVN